MEAAAALNWRVSAYEGKDRAIFYGPDGVTCARVFRGRIGREMALGLRGLESPVCARELQHGWRAELPPRWHERNNERDRRLMVFRSPSAAVGETVLEFDSPVPRALELALVNVFNKENGHGQEVKRRSAQAVGQDESLPGGEGAALQGQRGQHGLGAVQQDEPQGQPLRIPIQAGAEANGVSLAGLGGEGSPPPPAVDAPPSFKKATDWLLKRAQRAGRRDKRRRRR